MKTRNKTIDKGWTVDRLPDLNGKTYLVTGANSGIGFETCRHLRNKHANVILAARSTSKGEEAVERLERIESPGTLTLVNLDLGSRASITAAAEQVRDLVRGLGGGDQAGLDRAGIDQTGGGLDAVINNAGVMQTPQQETADGFELQFGTNHLGHFLLNSLLFDLVQLRSGRIVPVSSIVHLRGRSINFADPMLTRGYSPTTAYVQSKLANLTYGMELARRLEAADSPVASVSCHPGYSNTNLQRSGPTGLLKTMYQFTNLLAQRARDGAVPVVLAAAGTEARNGAYYGPVGLGEARGSVGDGQVNPAALDLQAGTQLWELSEELLGIKWDIA